MQQKTNLNLIKRSVKIKIFVELCCCHENNILQFNQYMKSDKIPYIVYTDLEFFIKKLDGCANNPEKSSTSKMGEHFPR